MNICAAMITLGSHSGVSVRRASKQDKILAVKNPGVSLCPSYENGGRAVPPDTIVVLLQDITGEKGCLFIRYPDLIRTMYWV